MSVRKVRAWVVGAAASSVLALTVGSLSAGAVTIELKDVAADRVERQRAFAEGRLPLVGTPNLGDLDSRLAATGLKPGAPMFIRILKAESLLEIWMLKGDRFVLFTSYPICHWSGTLGPKSREGDRQNPEGFYSVTQRQLHRIGRWPRSLNLGFPNNYDRVFGRTGSYILVHGGCSSTGCFAMTNAVIEEIYNLTERSLKAGQERVHVHVYPFRLSQENLDRHRKSEWHEFWTNLKEGYDAFEETRIPPRISVCDKRYLVQNVLRHNGPEEVADPGPLALCGEQHAAMPQSEKLSFIADRVRRLWRQRHSSSMTNPWPPYASLASAPSPSLASASATTTPDKPALPSPAAARPIPLQPPCDLSLPSCRRWSSLQAKAASRAVAVAKLAARVASASPARAR